MRSSGDSMALRDADAPISRSHPAARWFCPLGVGIAGLKVRCGKLHCHIDTERQHGGTGARAGVVDGIDLHHSRLVRVLDDPQQTLRYVGSARKLHSVKHASKSTLEIDCRIGSVSLLFFKMCGYPPFATRSMRQTPSPCLVRRLEVVDETVDRLVVDPDADAGQSAQERTPVPHVDAEFVCRAGIGARLADLHQLAHVAIDAPPRFQCTLNGPTPA